MPINRWIDKEDVCVCVCTHIYTSRWNITQLSINGGGGDFPGGTSGKESDCQYR